MLVATGLAVLSALGVIRTLQGFPMLKLGSAIEAILLALALAGRINALRREREEAQRELLRSRIARLEAVSALVSGVAHEIGNPLNAARGGAEELARRLEAGDREAARRAQALAMSGMSRIARILEQLRGHLRGEAERSGDGGEIAAALQPPAER
jgi:signal transduction histidine kinase